MKRFIKRLLTFVRHPIVFLYFCFHNNWDLVVGPGMQINSLKNVSFGKGVSIGKDSRFVCVSKYAGQKYSPSIVIGEYVSVVNRFTVLSAAPVEIGDYCLIASDVLITSEKHKMDPEKSRSYEGTPLEAAAVRIGEGCFIGEKVSIMPGVEIGERCVVATNAVVTKSFPPYSMIAGIPARRIKTYDKSKHEWISAIGE